MEPFKVLVIVSVPEAQAPLNTRPEVQSIVRAHGADNVTTMYNPQRIEIAEQIGQDNFEILHLAGHCNSQGFILKEGILPAEALAAYALSMAPTLKIVIINSCEGREIADLISASSNVDVAYSETQVEDSECIDYAVLFHTKLRSSNVSNCYEAYRLVVVDPTGSKFKYRRGTLYTSSMARNIQDNSDLREIKDAVAEIKDYLIGTLEKQGLVGRVRTLEQNFARADTRIEHLEKQLNRHVLPSPVDERIFYRRLFTIVISVLIFSLFVYFLSRGPF